jgi:branched-chain amino acid transport system substrate-binding protein
MSFGAMEKNGPVFRIFLAAVVVLLVGPMMAGCAGVGERPVAIGALYNLTGAQQSLDVPSSEGARLAVDQADKGGGLLGRPVRLTLIDGQTKPALIADEAKWLFEREPEVAGLIGFSDTDMVLAAAPIAAKHHRVFLTSGASSPRLPAQVPEYLFLACFGDNVQAAAGAEWAYRSQKARRVAVIYNETTSYTQLLHGYFETRFKELGGKLLSVQPYRPQDFKVDFRTLRRADMIYLAAYPDEVATVLPMLRKAGVTAPILGGDGLDVGAVWKTIPAIRNVYFTTHAYLGADNPDPAVQRFRKLYAAAHPNKEPDAFTALGYDAARLLLAAIETAGSTEPRAVRTALAATTGFDGVTGKISFLGGSRIPSKSVTVMRVDGGRQKYVGSILPDKIPAP